MTARTETLARYTLDALPMGVDLDSGELWRQSLWERHTLAGGVPGSGKSGYINALLGLLSALPDVQIAGIDRKRGVELGPWRDRLCRLAVSLDEAGALLDELVALTNARYDYMAERGARSAWEPPMLGDPTVGPLVVIVDELTLVLAAASDSREDKAALHARVAALKELVIIARAAGVCMVLATQKPLSSAIPTDIRDNVQTRVSFATTTPAMTDVILGEGATKAGANPVRFNRPDWRGCGVIADEGREGYRNVRPVYLTDADVRERVAQTRHLRDDPWRFLPGNRTASGLHVPSSAGTGATARRELEPPASGPDDDGDLARELFEED